MEGMGATSLPPGFRFHPTDDELVGYYLKRKVDGKKIELEVIPVIDLYKFDPWELPDKSFLPKRDMEWFFFCPRDRKYPNGSRTNRATASGYWKATGKDRKIICEPSTIGLRKTLVFYRGRAPAGDRTDWVMHEYRLCEELPHGSSAFVGAFALCRVIKRSEQGQKISEASGEPKSKRVAYSAFNYLSTGRINGEALGVHEADERSHFNRNNVLTPTTTPSENRSGTESEPIMIDGYQTNHGSHNHHLLDSSLVLSVGDGASSLTTQFTNSMVDSSQYEPMNVSLMLPPTTSFMGETYAAAGVNDTGSSMTSLNPLDFMETCTNEGAIAFPAFEGVASWNMNPSVSDIET